MKHFTAYRAVWHSPILLLTLDDNNNQIFFSVFVACMLQLDLPLDLLNKNLYNIKIHYTYDV